MAFEFTGKVIDIREKSGNSDRGPWKVWECVVEYDTSGQYPQRVVLTTRKEDIYNTMKYCQQYKVDVHATTSIDAREYNGSWFNSIVVHRAEACQQQGYQPPMQQTVQPMLRNRRFPISKCNKPMVRKLADILSSKGMDVTGLILIRDFRSKRHGKADVKGRP